MDQDHLSLVVSTGTGRLRVVYPTARATPQPSGTIGHLDDGQREAQQHYPTGTLTDNARAQPLLKNLKGPLKGLLPELFLR